MGKENFKPGDWVSIKYGELQGSFGKISIIGKNGDINVITYSDENEPSEMKNFSRDVLELLPPYEVSLPELKQIARGKLTYEELEDEVFPQFNLKSKRHYALLGSDIAKALKNIMKSEEPLESFKSWFWLIINIFYDNFRISERFISPDTFTEANTDDEKFSVIFAFTENLYWRLEERFGRKEDSEKHIIKFDKEPDWNIGKNENELEEEAFLILCKDIIARQKAYEHNDGLPKEEWIYSNDQKKEFILLSEENGLEKLKKEEIKKYKQFVMDLEKEDDVLAIKILAWAYYEGSIAFKQNWALSEKYLLKLFEMTGDPFAANSLGYIYYYGRTKSNVSDYESAFKFFSFGALAGIDESIYKCADMLIKGLGTKKNVDMGLNMIVDGYKATLEEFENGNYESKFADYALRMGNACKKRLIYGMGLRDAYKFYLEAKFAIRRRREVTNYFGDGTVESNIDKAMEEIQEEVNLDLSRRVLKADFPLYINQLYEDLFPIKVKITPKTLTIKRFRLEEENLGGMPLPEKLKAVPEILTSYPELSYAGLTSELKFNLEGAEIHKKPEDEEFFLSDGFRRNEVTEALEFYRGGELVAALEAKWYVVRVR